MADSTAISGQGFLLVMLDRFSQRRKMPLEKAHLMLELSSPNFLLEDTAVLR